MAVTQGGTYNLEIVQGATYRKDFFLRQKDQVTPIALNGYTAKSEIRSKDNDTGELLGTFTTEVDGPTGRVTLRLTSAETAVLARSGFYDVFLVSPGETALFLEGSVTLNKKVTAL